MLDLNIASTPEQTNISTFHEVPAKKPVSILPSVYALLQNARVLIRHGEDQLALNLLRQASTIQTHEVIFEEMAHVLIRSGKWDEAKKVVEQWYRLSTNFRVCFCKAQIEYELQMDEKSLQSYFEALSYIIEAQPELFEIFKNIGNIYVRRSDFESAEEFYNKAYAVRPDSDILLVNYGILEMQRGDLNRAKDRFRSALHLNDQNDKAWVGLAMVHFEFGDEELGVANLKKALDLAPHNKTAIHFALQKMGHRQYSAYMIEALERFLDQADFDEEISCQLIQKFYEVGKLELAHLEAQRLFLWAPEKAEYARLFTEIEQQMQVREQAA